MQFKFDLDNTFAKVLVRTQMYLNFFSLYATLIFLAIFGIPFAIQEIFAFTIETSLVIGISLSALGYKLKR